MERSVAWERRRGFTTEGTANTEEEGREDEEERGEGSAPRLGTSVPGA